MLDENIIRWINASINKFFEDRRSTIKLYVEGEKIDLNSFQSWAELRLTGPRYKELSKGCYSYEVDINLLISQKSDLEDTYAIHKKVGIFAKAINNQIPVYKYGDDDDSLIGCLILRDDVPRSVDIVQWGILDASSDIYQTSIDGFFRMEI